MEFRKREIIDMKKQLFHWKRLNDREESIENIVNICLLPSFYYYYYTYCLLFAGTGAFFLMEENQHLFIHYIGQQTFLCLKC